MGNQAKKQIPAAPLPYGQLLILQGGYEYEVNSKHAEWLDVLALRANAYPKLQDDRRKLVAALSDYVAAHGGAKGCALLRELGEL